MRYGLAARTESGAVDLPFSAKTTDALATQARWLCDVLGVRDVCFDPQVMNSDVRKRPQPKSAQTRIHLGRWIGRVMGITFALAVAAFVVIFIAVTAGWTV